MSSLAQTYLLASKVKQKLTKEAVNPNANLRILVCQANLLDNLMDSLQHKKPLPNFPSISVSSMRIEEEDIEDESLSSSSDEDEEYYDHEDINETGIDIFNSPANITTTELLEDDDEESDMEDYDVNNYNYSMRIIDESDADYDEYVSSDSSMSSDEELDITDNDQDTPPSSVEDDLFLSLSKLSSTPYSNRNYKMVSVENELPLLSHCSSISSEESVEDGFESDNEINHSHFKTHNDSAYSLLETSLVA